MSETVRWINSDGDECLGYIGEDGRLIVLTISPAIGGEAPMTDIKLAKCRCKGEGDVQLADAGPETHFVICDCGWQSPFRLTPTEAAQAWNAVMDNVAMFDEVCELVQESLNVAKSMGDGWISVEDRLPDELERVLVYTVNGSVSWDMVDGGVWVYKGVTHWQPLPSPPARTGDRTSVQKIIEIQCGLNHAGDRGEG